MAQKPYPDRSTNEGDQFVTISQSGPKARRVFVVDDLTLTTPTSTLYTAITNGALKPTNPNIDVPIRMTPHPTIIFATPWSDYYQGLGTFDVSNAFCADVLSIKNLDDKAVVDVEYAILNGETQEASADGDAAPGLLQVGSSVHAMKVFTDIDGNRLIIPYQASGGPGAYTITQNGEVLNPANNAISAEVQVPSKLFRFTRRERAPRVSDQLEGLVNSASWTIAGFDCVPGTLFCTRAENTTRDNGQSYIVLYEFQWLDLLSVADANYVSASCVPSGGGVVSAWQSYGYYTLPNGSRGTDGSNIIGPNQNPSDAMPSVYQQYPAVDFNSALHLN